jgi:hypothetical protein
MGAFKAKKIGDFPNFSPFKYKLNVLCGIFCFCCLRLRVAAKWGKSGEKSSPETKKALKLFT